MNTMPAAPLSGRLKRRPRTMPLAVVPLPKPPAPRRPCRITLRPRRGGIAIPEGAVAIIGSWGCPFRIRQAPAGRKPYRVDWCPSGMGRNRCRPVWWEPINCPDRRSAQLEILAALELWLEEPEQADLVAKIRAELRGKPLACCCGPSTPCHGNVLVRIANMDLDTTLSIRVKCQHETSILRATEKSGSR
jgi:hypothetical protein